jgi:hypothetical protein
MWRGGNIASTADIDQLSRSTESVDLAQLSRLSQLSQLSRPSDQRAKDERESMPAVAYNRFHPRGQSRWTLAAKFAAAVLSLPTTVMRAVYGAAWRAMGTEGMADIDGARKLCWARLRRDDP